MSKLLRLHPSSQQGHHYIPKNGASDLPRASAKSKPFTLILQIEFNTIPAYERYQKIPL